MIHSISQRFLNDKEIVLATVEQNGLALEFASENLKNNQELVLAAAKSSVFIFAQPYVPKTFVKNREFILNLIENKVNVLRYASKTLQSDREVVHASVKNIGATTLENASDELKSDKKFIMRVIIYDGWRVYAFISENLRNDKDCKNALWTITNPTHWMRSGLPELLKSEDFAEDRGYMMHLIKECSVHTFEQFSEKFRDDDEIATAAVTKQGSMIEHASERIRNTKSIALLALRRGCVSDHSKQQCFGMLSKSLQEDVEIKQAAGIEL